MIELILSMSDQEFGMLFFMLAGITPSRHINVGVFNYEKRN